MVTSVENAHSESNIADDPVNINNRNNNRDYQAVDRDYQEDAPAFNDSDIAGFGKLSPISPELFGRLFPADAEAVNSAAAYVACHLEGFGVDQGPGIGQANIDERTLAINSAVALAALKAVSYAADPEDAAKQLDKAARPNARDKASKEFRRMVSQYRAIIKSHGQLASTDKALCDLPANFNNTHEIITTQIVPHLHAAGCYVRERGLCRVVPASGTSDKQNGLTVNGLTIDDHTLPSLSTDITKSLAFRRERETRVGTVLKPCPAPEDLMKMVLRLGDWAGVPYLKGVTTGPFLRTDGTACVESGYDALSGWFLDYDGEPIHVKANPTKSDAKHAVGILLDPLDEFEWAADCQKTGWLAYLLTLVARPGIRGNVPAFIFTSNDKRTGKSLLTNIANLIAYGDIPSGYQPPTGENATTEWKKSLFAFALSGNPSLVVSNVPSGSNVGNAVLDGVITDGRIVDRTLGKHDMRSAPWVAVISMNGNNLGTSADFAPRSIWTCLEPTSENAGERDGFKIADLLGHMRGMRGILLESCLTILRWGYLHGRVKPSADMPNSGGFEQWAATVRYPLAHLTGHDISKNGSEAVVMDTTGNELASLITGLTDYTEWRTATGKPGAFTMSELHADMNTFGNETSWPELREVLEPSASVKAFGSSAGKVLGTYRGRVWGTSKLVEKLVGKKPFWSIERR